jgi:hypothetical protein
VHKVFIKSVKVALIAAALGGCNEEPATVTVNSAAKVAKDSRVVALTTLKAATEAKQAGVAGDLVIVLGEDQAAFNKVIENLKNRLNRKNPAGADTGEPNAKEKRRDQK